MKLLEGIYSSLHHFRIYPLRTSLTLLGVVIGSASIVAMIGIGEGTRAKIIGDMEKLGGTGLIVVQNDHERAKMSRMSETNWRLTLNDYRAILESSNLIDKSSPVARIVKLYSAGKKRSIGPFLGVKPEFFGMRYWDIESGRIIHDIDVQNASKICVLGYEISKKLFADGLNPIGRSILIGTDVEFTIVGVMSEHQIEGAQWMNMQVFIPITTLQTRLAGNDYLERILIKAYKTQDVPTIVRQIKKVLNMNHDNPQWFNIYSQTKIINTVKGSTLLLRFSFGSIAFIMLVISGIGIMNLMLVSVMDRTREIGVRKTVGAKGFDIFLQFFLESIMLTGLGGVIGILAGIKAGDIFSMLVAEYLGDRVMSIVTVKTLVISITSVIIVGVVFGLYPAIKAARLDPSEAVSYE